MIPAEAIRQGKGVYFNKSGIIKITHDYYYQIQGQLEITNRKYCQQVVYTSKRIFMQRIKRDDFLEKNLSQFVEFLLLFFIARSS